MPAQPKFENYLKRVHCAADYCEFNFEFLDKACTNLSWTTKQMESFKIKPDPLAIKKIVLWHQPDLEPSFLYGFQLFDRKGCLLLQSYARVFTTNIYRRHVIHLGEGERICGIRARKFSEKEAHYCDF